MDGDQFAHTVWIILALVLVTSGIIARRMPIGKTASLAAIWLGIFLALFAIITWAQRIL
jgi:predicted aspartyl protease